MNALLMLVILKPSERGGGVSNLVHQHPTQHMPCLGQIHRALKVDG